MSRYYGPGYERGDYATIYLVAQWIERMIPGGEVWYGGDSSGVNATRFDKDAREALLDHFFEFGNGPYENGFGSGMPAVPCTFCGDEPMAHYGGYGTISYWECCGCGRKALYEKRYDTLRLLARGTSFVQGVASFNEELAAKE